MNIENLDKIIAFFERLNPANFQLEDIAIGEIENLRAIAKQPDQHFCGTAGCIVGYFPAIFPDKFCWYGIGEIIDVRNLPNPVVGDIVDRQFARIVGCSRELASYIVYPSGFAYGNEDFNADGRVTLEAVLRKLKQLRSGEVNESNYVEEWEVKNGYDD